MSVEKLDLAKKYRSYYTAKPVPELVKLDPAVYLSIVGKGDPSGQSFADHVEALYSVGYTIKFFCKNSGQDFVVAKLEGLWWYNEARYPNKTVETATEVPRSEWEYRLLIRMPDYVTTELVDKSAEAVVTRKGLALASEVDFFEMNEGECVQMLHVGPFDTEVDSLKQMARFMADRNLLRNGPHHEIYLSDFRKTTPEKLKTILREPVK